MQVIQKDVSETPENRLFLAIVGTCSILMLFSVILLLPKRWQCRQMHERIFEQLKKCDVLSNRRRDDEVSVPALDA